jgi:hypothetical protein
MASVRIWAVVGAGLVLAGCNQPTPIYAIVKEPAPYRTQQNGQWIDNEDYALDAQGYRVDKQGNRIGVVDIPGKTAGEKSNAMAGFYISSTGRKAPGNVMVPSEGSDAGAGYGPGSANPMPSGGMPAPSSIISPGPGASGLGPAATGNPTPITPTPTTPTPTTPTPSK